MTQNIFLNKLAAVAPAYKLPEGFSTYGEYSESMRNKDQQLYEQWAKTKSKKDLGKLMDSLNSLIYTEVRRQVGSLPPAALSAEAKKWTLKAIQTYDPSKGAMLSTHVVNWLQKVRRTNYKYQNSARLPENMQIKFHEYNHAKTFLTEELNREPTDAELASKLGWTKPQTVRFKDRIYSDLVESASERPQEFSRFNEQALFMEHLMGQLSEQEKFILHNNKVISSTELANKLGVNINRLNYLKTNLKNKIMHIKTESGMF